MAEPKQKQVEPRFWIDHDHDGPNEDWEVLAVFNVPIHETVPVHHAKMAVDNAMGAALPVAREAAKVYFEETERRLRVFPDTAFTAFFTSVEGCVAVAVRVRFIFPDGDPVGPGDEERIKELILAEGIMEAKYDPEGLGPWDGKTGREPWTERLPNNPLIKQRDETRVKKGSAMQRTKRASVETMFRDLESRLRNHDWYGTALMGDHNTWMRAQKEESMLRKLFMTLLKMDHARTRQLWNRYAPPMMHAASRTKAGGEQAHRNQGVPFKGESLTMDIAERIERIATKVESFGKRAYFHEDDKVLDPITYGQIMLAAENLNPERHGNAEKRLKEAFKDMLDYNIDEAKHVFQQNLTKMVKELEKRESQE